ncbi:MAG: 23S rRNA (uracil(1939)-C(5))-methyltransferase RlmD [Caldilineales bacterium]|nr:23S rRNA (uracil(1939)-C(5))-methyltransferase RlmD [Caldilineales bacterium]MDW8317104.1 23S rRNA (uracil(1939)-C(5))-methyltransferase RlmD [Anaerolineae bacterium]
MPPITLTLTGIAHGGEAFGVHDGRIVFVPYAIPGEQVQVELVEAHRRWARARLLRVLSPSPDRVEPPCPYFGPGRCGGCQWQHIAYERQLYLKAEVVADQLRRLGGVAEPPVLDMVALADDQGLLAYRYRNHAQFYVNAEGELCLVREAGSRSAERDTGRRSQRADPADLIPVDQCLLLHPLLDELHAAAAGGLLSDRPIFEEEASGDEEEAAPPPPRVRRLYLRAGVHTGQRLLVFETEDDRAPNFAVEELAVSCALRRRNGAVVPLIGEPWIEETVAGRTFRVSAGSFFQVNTVGAEVLVALAAEMLAPQGHETLLDAYCGVGLFGLSLADQVGHVVGIEESEAACEDFAWNARDLDNVTLHEGPVEQVLAVLDEPVDLALLDPPRSGAGPEVVRHLARLGVPRLLYVSCDPATLARDAKLLLAAGYRLEQVQPVDLFPQTFHVETLALFTRPQEENRAAKG